MLKAREAMTTTTIAQTQTAVDPTEARAAFFYNLELKELMMVVPQSAAPEPAAKY